MESGGGEMEGRRGKEAITKAEANDIESGRKIETETEGQV